MEPALRRAAPETIGWSGWLRRPAVSMALAFLVLILAIGFFSNRPASIAPSVSLQLSADRGEVPSTAPGRQFDLGLPNAPGEGGPFRVEVVNAMGVSMWSSLVSANPSGAPSGMHINVTQQLLPGDYVVRLHAVDGSVLRDYPFRVR